MIELPTIPGYGNGVGSFGSSRYIPSLDLAFAEDKAFTVNTASPGNASITSRRGPSANFLRQSGATFINDQGLIEYAPENLVIYSEDPSNANWYKADAVAVTLTTDPTPTGSLNAYRVDATYSGNGIIASIGGVPTGSSLVTGSIWLKASSPIPLNTFISLRSDIGSLILEQGITITSEWQRFSITGNTGGNSVIRVGVGGNNTFDYGKSFYIWGAQIERHSSARTYRPTTTSPFYGPRFDHDPVTKVCRGLFIEGTSTNLSVQSNAFSTIPWGENSGTVTISQNQTGPDGVTNSAWMFTDDNAASIEGRYQSISLVSGSTYAISVYVKKTTGIPASFPALTFARGGAGSGGAVLNTTTGTITPATSYAGLANILATVNSINAGDYWRISAVFASTATGSWDIAVIPAFNTSGDGVSNVAATGSAVFFGHQVEAGSTASSYIPTTSGTVIRSADISSIVGDDFTSFYNQSEGTLVTQHFRGFQQGAIATIAVGGLDSGKIQIFQISASLGTIESTIKASNNSVVFLNQFAPISEVNKTSLAYKLNDSASSCNGSVAVTDTEVVMDSTRTQLLIGVDSISRRFGGHIASITYYKRRLPNRNLQLLTAP